MTGQNGLTELEAAEMIIAEAKKLFADDLLQLGVDWKLADNLGILSYRFVGRPLPHFLSLFDGGGVL